MIERTYYQSPSTGQSIGQGGTFDVRTGASRAMAPADMPAPDAHVSADHQVYPGWDPNGAPIDPHNADFEPANGQPPSTGPVPTNIDDDGDIGDIDADFDDYSNDEPPPPNIVV